FAYRRAHHRGSGRTVQARRIASQGWERVPRYALPRRPSPRTSMAELELRGVRKAYGATQALRRGDLTLEAGEVHVLIGSNGSGKSTLCKIVAGSVRPDEGEVLRAGQPVTVSGPKAARA